MKTINFYHKAFDVRNLTFYKVKLQCTVFIPRLAERLIEFLSMVKRRLQYPMDLLSSESFYDYIRALKPL